MAHAKMARDMSKWQEAATFALARYLPVQNSCQRRETAKMAGDMSKWQTANMAGGFSLAAKMAGGGRGRGGVWT